MVGWEARGQMGGLKNEGMAMAGGGIIVQGKLEDSICDSG
jgi:hypothetical protein